MARSTLIEAEVSDPVGIARRLWCLAGAPLSLLSGEAPPELLPWRDCAHAAFEELVAALRPAQVREALRGALAPQAGPEKILEMRSRLLAVSSEAYLAATNISGLAATLADPALVGILPAVPSLLSWEPGAGAPADGKPGLPLVYEVIALS